MKQIKHLLLYHQKHTCCTYELVCPIIPMSNLNSLLAYSYFLYGWLNLISVYTPQVLLSSSIDGSVLQKKHNVPCKPIYPKLQPNCRIWYILFPSTSLSLAAEHNFKWLKGKTQTPLQFRDVSEFWYLKIDGLIKQSPTTESGVLAYTVVEFLKYIFPCVVLNLISIVTQTAIEVCPDAESSAPFHIKSLADPHSLQLETSCMALSCTSCHSLSTLSRKGLSRKDSQLQK